MMRRETPPAPGPNTALQHLLDRGIHFVERLAAGHVSGVEANAHPTNPQLTLHLGSLVDAPDKVADWVETTAVPAFRASNVVHDATGLQARTPDGVVLRIQRPSTYYPEGAYLLDERRDLPGREAPYLTSASTFVGRLALPLSRARVETPPPDIATEPAPHALVEGYTTATTREALYRVVGKLSAADCTVEGAKYTPATAACFPEVAWFGRDAIGGNRFQIKVVDSSPEGQAERANAYRG